MRVNNTIVTRSERQWFAEYGLHTSHIPFSALSNFKRTWTAGSVPDSGTCRRFAENRFPLVRDDEQMEEIL